MHLVNEKLTKGIRTLDSLRHWSSSPDSDSDSVEAVVAVVCGPSVWLGLRRSVVDDEWIWLLDSITCVAANPRPQRSTVTAHWTTATTHCWEKQALVPTSAFRIWSMTWFYSGNRTVRGSEQVTMAVILWQRRQELHAKDSKFGITLLNCEFQIRPERSLLQERFSLQSFSTSNFKSRPSG